MNFKNFLLGKEPDFKGRMILLKLITCSKVSGLEPVEDGNFMSLKPPFLLHSHF